MTEYTLFALALEKSDPQERAAFLQTSCAGDAALLQQVSSLLQAHDRAGKFLQRPAAQQIAPLLAQEEGLLFPPVGCGPGLRLGSTQDNLDTAEEFGEPMDLGFLAPPTRPSSLGRFGPFEVLEVLGRGSAGVVLKADDEELQRLVALKVLAPHLEASPSAQQRFVREARAVATVCHDHVVTIHSAGKENGISYLVMQYIAGLSLQQRLQSGPPLPLAEIVRIGQETAQALAAAHARGLVHRDVKPGNILLEDLGRGDAGRVKLSDFGLARAVDDTSLTRPGVIAGTPQYMAPEQARGQAVDARSDLFSLGGVLYTLCTGRPPFQADNTLAVLQLVCEQDPRPIRDVNPSIPRWLAGIISRLLAKDPAQRFQSAAEVAELLRGCLAHLRQPRTVPLPPIPGAATPRIRGFPRRFLAAAWRLAGRALRLLVFSV